MSKIALQILHDRGNVTKQKAVVNKWKFQDAMMGEQYISFTITSEKPIAWEIGDYCIFRGEQFTLNYIPSVTQKARTKERQDAYTYENVKFDSFQEELTRCLMLDITPTTGDYKAALGTNYTGSSKFQLFCGESSINGSTLTAVCALAAKMQANLDRMFPKNGWKVLVDTITTYLGTDGNPVLVTHTDDKVLTFDNTTVAAALAEVHNTFDLDYCVRGRTIYIGYNLKNLTSDNDDETFAFGYGKGYPTHDDQNKALFQLKRIANSQQKIVTRLRALGSTKNLPYRYYNKKYSNGNDDLSQTLFPTNLQLPDTFIPEGKKTDVAGTNSKWGHNKQRDSYLRAVKGDTNDAYIDKNDDAENCAEGIREESARWDGTNSDLPEIYPTIEEATYGELRSALVEDQDGKTGANSFPNYGSTERIDALLAVGYMDNSSLVDDANKGDGILPESGSTDTGTPRPATIGQTSLYYNTKNRGDFTSKGSYYAGAEKTLFTIQDVMPGEYAMAPTIGAVFYGFSLSCYKDGVSADVGYIITIKAKVKATGKVTTIATYTSDYMSIARGDGIKEMELPEIPDVKNGSSAKVKSVKVSELSDITVTFTPTMKNITVPSGFTDNFALVYKVGNSRLDTTVTYDPEYTWISADNNGTTDETFHVFVKDMGFDITACWTDDTPTVYMKSGRCVGREFEIMENVQKVTYNGKKGYMLTLKRATDSSLNTYYPSATDPIEAGDYFVLLNISMPDVYVKMAEVRLLRAATDYLADNCETKFTYQPYIDDIYLQRNLDLMEKDGTPDKSIFWRLYAGLKFTFRGIPSSEDDPLPLADITIEQVSIQMGEGLTPKVELTLNDDVQQSTLQKLTTSVDRIYNGSLFSSGSGGVAGTGANAAALYSILQSEGEKLFLSKKKDDTAEGKITFNDVDTHNATSKFKKGLKVGNFQSRLLGSGAIIDEEGNAEFESIYSRNFISTPEFRFNRISVTEGEQWNTNGYGTIQEVERIDETTGYITLKLEENDYASIEAGDICRGIYNDIASEYETASLDDDTELYAGDGEGAGFGFSSKEGFFTSYFWVKQMITNQKGECKFLYELRNANTPHPCEFMKFAQYGSFTNSARRSSSYATSIGHYYEMVLDGVSTWKIQSANVVFRKGYLGNMTVTLKNGKEAELKGYGIYCQDNVYFGNAIIQLDPETLANLEDQLKSYTVEFSEHVDVITVDDVGNVIGGLYTKDGDYKKWRIQSAITVRSTNGLLTIAEDGKDAEEGTYKIYAQAKGCTCKIENSTLYITGIDNIKDGVAGSEDDTNFDYDAMRDMDACSVDLIIDCEGRGSIQKSFPIRIKHDSQPFVAADISNEFSAVSWNTKLQKYIGLPFDIDMKMWHNNETLAVTSIAVNGVQGATTATPTKQITVDGIVIATSLVKNEDNELVGRVQIVSLPNSLALVTNLNITGTAEYSGISYERTLVHTINKSTDTNVYSLLPSVSEVIVDQNDNAVKEISANVVGCSVVCDSSDDKHYTVPVADYATHKITLYYQLSYANGTATTESPYDTSKSGVGIDTSVSEITFLLYGLDADGKVDKTILHDKETVPVVSNGIDGKGVEYVFFQQNAETPKPTIRDDSQSTTKDSGQTKTRKELFQEDDYCPYNTEGTQQWTDEPVGVGENSKCEFYAQRKKVNGVWQPFGDVLIWNRYVVDGVSPYMIDLSNEQSFVNCNEDGGVLSGANYETSRLMIFKGNGYAFTDFNIVITPTNITCNGNTSAFSLTEAQKTTAQTNGYFTLTPSAITANSAQISIRATLKTNTSIVLVAVYKLNKNIAGQNGVIYSLIPSLNVIHKNNDDTFRDTTMSVQVNKIVGSSVTELTTKAQLTNEGITLTYQGSHSSKQSVSGLSNLSTSDLCGTANYTKLFLRKGETLLDSERINVVKDGDDASEVNPNILLRTIFDKGLEFVKEAWTLTNETYEHIDTATDTIVEGRRSFRLNAASLSNYLDFRQDVYGKLKTGTWYTLSFNSFSTAEWHVYVYDGSSNTACVDQSAGFYVDGTFVSSVPRDGMVKFPSSWSGERHSITFKTASSFSTEHIFILFRALSGCQVAICMPKLEIGEVATAYMAQEDDLSGASYYLTSSVNSLVKNYLGQYKYSSRILIRGWKKVGDLATTPLSDVVDSDGVFADGLKIAVDKYRGTTPIGTQYTSLNGSLTYEVSSGASDSADRIEVTLTKGDKIYATLAIPIIQEQRGEAGADGVCPRDCGLFDPEIATSQKFGYAGYIYRKVGDMVFRDMVRYEIGGVMYGFLVKTKSQTALVTAAPTSASGDSNWESVGILETVIANTIFGTNANIGGFIASLEKLRSSTPAYRVKYMGEWKAATRGLYFCDEWQSGTNYSYTVGNYNTFPVVHYNGGTYNGKTYSAGYFRLTSSTNSSNNTIPPPAASDKWTAIANEEYGCLSSQDKNNPFVVPQSSIYKYDAANGDTPAIRPLVLRSGKYYVAKGTRLGTELTSSSFSTNFWREAFDFEVGGVVNVNDTVDVPTFTLNGRTGTMIMRQADDTIYTYDETGKQTTGFEDGRRVVIDPVSKSVAIFNNTGTQVITINGETKSSMNNAYEGDSGGQSIGGDYIYEYNSTSYAKIVTSVIHRLGNNFTIGDNGYNFQYSGSISAQAGYSTSSVWCPDQEKSILGYIQPIAVGSQWGHQSYCKAELILVKVGGGTTTLATVGQGANGNTNTRSFDAVNIRIGSGTYYLAIRYTCALYGNHSARVTWGDISFSYAKNTYMGEVFGNGLAFGNNAQNFFAVIKESNTALHLKVLSNNKYGLEITNSGIKVCINGTWYTLGVSGGQATLT